eukprot:CAMPEP_0196722468 /NCGR_PEP_ID=MMETSP1091-20130531/4830_1 /TAXON_ID=302021 /ORGANISM="Rhodomonas sp., Strain CCMP768" /LENGTH=123 /DNA_ID=CAMNT_0042064179 /DNA_START=68 /DNA_END=440 /DNA_ORIENTATION=-
MSARDLYPCFVLRSPSNPDPGYERDVARGVGGGETEADVMLEEMQMKEQVTMYNSLVERCFANCVNGFRQKTLDEKEDKCVKRCTMKFIKASARAGQTFQQVGMQMPGQPGAATGPGAGIPGQ